MWIGLLNPDYFGLLISFFRVTGCPLAHTSVLVVIGQEIATVQIGCHQGDAEVGASC
jgi:hypothetical protein